MLVYTCLITWLHWVQEDYGDGDDIGTLDCGHDFHSDCIKQWLMHKNLCPICKTTGLATWCLWLYPRAITMIMKRKMHNLPRKFWCFAAALSSYLFFFLICSLVNCRTCLTKVSPTLPPWNLLYHFVYLSKSQLSPGLGDGLVWMKEQFLNSS